MTAYMTPDVIIGKEKCSQDSGVNSQGSGGSLNTGYCFMKSDRLLSALLLLQAHGRLTSRELAERLEVTARTIHRDMEALSASGVPVYALRGAQGGWQLDEN